MTEYSVGDVVAYLPFGVEDENKARVVVVESRDEHNGQPAFDGYQIAEPQFLVWGYDDQIVRVLGRYRVAVLEGLAEKWGAIARYMPANYTATVDGNDVRITGWDSHGWTLDAYVIPRLASGMFYAVEVTP